MIQLEREDRQHQIEKQLCRENVGKCCSTKLEGVDATFYNAHGWRGWVVYCLICGNIILEIDE